MPEAGGVAVHPGVGEAGEGREHPQGSAGSGAGVAGVGRGGPGREEGAPGVWVTALQLGGCPTRGRGPG